MIRRPPTLIGLKQEDLDELKELLEAKRAQKSSADTPIANSSILHTDTSNTTGGGGDLSHLMSQTRPGAFPVGQGIGSLYHAETRTRESRIGI